MWFRHSWLTKCVSYAMVAHMALQRVAWSALICFRVPRCRSAHPGEMPACPWPKLPQIKYGLWGLRMSKCSANFQRCYFPTNLLEQLMLELLCAQWFLRVTCQLSSLCSVHFKMPMDFSDRQLDFQMWTLVCVTRQLDKACVSNITGYSWSMGAPFKTRKKPLLPMKLGEK